ncbi:MAG: DUF3307 domain-containing protein [Actinobacteria bacterium]|jgi:uncharacterized membrane protein YkvI|nr:DUF3307 domain-containing protein [Actinomycetota bacterium]
MFIIPFLVICVHYVADFIFQAEKWATTKSKSNLSLLSHVSVYSTLWILPSYAILANLRPGESREWYLYSTILFFILTFLSHFITDYITSRIVSEKFSSGKYGSPIPNFGAFSIIGLDQVLHYAQLFTTLYLLTDK